MRKIDIFHKVLGAIFLTVGLVLYVTPIPGTSLLIILGLVWLLGKHRTIYFLKEVLGKKIFKFFKPERFIKKI